MQYRFAQCTLDTMRHTIHRADQSIRLSRKVFEVLCYLIAHRDRVVSKDELCEQVWQSIVISDATLESCVHAVRTSVGDSGQAQRIIQTQRGYGYQFVAPVEIVTEEPPALLEESDAHEDDPTPRAVPLLPLVPSALPTSHASQAFSPALAGMDPTPSVTCHHPNQGDATFCAACGTRLRQTCRHCQQSNPLPAAFCMACGQPFVAVDLMGAPPRAAAPGSSSGERKPITVLCCAVTLMTQGGARVDLDTQHQILHGLYALAQDVMRVYGGRLHSALDERLLLMFGVPTAQEDDARRAVRVAFELQQRLRAHQDRFPDGLTVTLRIGVHTGPAIIGDRGEDPVAVATVVGDVMAGAIALQEHAPPGTVLCSDATARLLQGAVHLGEARVLQMLGDSAPVRAYPVMAETTWRPPGRLQGGRALRPFVGRGREMATLQALLEQAEAGRGQVVGVVGEAGIGKSRLLYEFRQSLWDREVTYRACRCLSYGNTTPYLPVLELLRAHCGIAETDSPPELRAKVEKSLQDMQMEATWAPVLCHLLGVHDAAEAVVALSPETRKARTLMALTQVCLHGARQRPLILEVEDLHWIDASSDECLNALVERIAGVPLLVLATYRPGHRPSWIDKSYATQLSLHPLGLQESLQVAQTILPSETLATPLVPQIVTKADGNPFFLEELARTVVEQGGTVSATTIPDTVHAVLTARIDRLPAPTKSVLQVVSVIGRDIALPLLQAIADVPDEALRHQLASLQAAEFLYETQTPSAPGYTFKHALTQEVAYQSLLRRQRQQYHARIAQVLETQFPEVVEQQPERLAQHYTGADQAARAIPYWQQAGQRAVERSANVEAISHFTKGLELLESLPETPEHLQQELALLVTLGPALLASKGYTASEAEQVYNRALALCQHVEDDSQHFLVLVGLWRFYLNRGQLQTAHRLGEEGFTIAQRLHEPGCLQEAHQMLGSTFFYMGNPTAARLHLEQGIALSPSQRDPLRGFTSGVDTEVMCRARAAWVLWILGYPDQALARVYEALHLAQQLSHSHSRACALHYAALLHQGRREPRLAQEQAEAAIALSREYGFVQWLLGGMFLRGWALAQQGAIEEGIAQLRHAMSTWHAIGTDIAQMHILVRLAEAYKMSGRYAEGLQALYEALNMKNQNEARYYEAEVHRLSGELLLHASSVAETATPFASVSPLVQAEASFLQALHIARGQQAKLLELRAVVSLGRLWSTQGKYREARNMLKETLHWFTEGYETLDLQEAKVLLDSLDEPIGRVKG